MSQKIQNRIYSFIVSNSWQNATLDSVKAFDKGGGLETMFCARFEKKLLKMEQFFVSLKGFPKFFRFIYFLLQVNFREI